MTALLTVRQPFATRIIMGLKSIENRTRQSQFRGRLGIHAGIAVWHDLTDAEAAVAMALPRAAVLGTVNMVGCHQSGDGCAALDCITRGGWASSPWHWEFKNAREFVTPIRHVRGQLGVWEAGPSVEHLMSIAEVVDNG